MKDIKKEYPPLGKMLRVKFSNGLDASGVMLIPNPQYMIDKTQSPTTFTNRAGHELINIIEWELMA